MLTSSQEKNFTGVIILFVIVGVCVLIIVGIAIVILIKKNRKKESSVAARQDFDEKSQSD